MVVQQKIIILSVASSCVASSLAWACIRVFDNHHNHRHFPAQSVKYTHILPPSQRSSSTSVQDDRYGVGNEMDPKVRLPFRSEIIYDPQQFHGAASLMSDSSVNTSPRPLRWFSFDDDQPATEGEVRKKKKGAFNTFYRNKSIEKQ